MFVKRSGKRIFGAEFTAAEKKAMDIEIRRQLAEYDRQHEKEMAALILWIKHELDGDGPKKLKRFFDEFDSSIYAMISRYELEEDDRFNLAQFKLNDYLEKFGTSLDEWYDEKHPSETTRE